MATRQDIREVFFTELKSALNVGTGSELVAEEDIGVQYPKDVEDLPAVVYTDHYRRVAWNGIGGPHRTDYTGSTADQEVWYEVVEGQFVVNIADTTETAKEAVYEAVRSHFQKYVFSQWNPRDLDPDLVKIVVEESRSVDETDPENTVYSDSLSVYFTFKREYTFTTDNITQINLATDNDTDAGTSGNNYTVT